MHLGSPTRFSHQDVPGYDTLVWLRDKLPGAQKIDFTNHYSLAKLSPQLHSMLVDVMTVSWFLDGHEGQGVKLNSYTFHDLLVYLGYGLLHIAPLAGRQYLNHLENIVQLGLIAFLATFLFPLGHHRVDCPRLSSTIYSAAQNDFNEDMESQQALLWMLFIGRATIFSEDEEVWMLPRMKKAMTILAIHTWEDVSRTLCKFPWLRNIHTKSAKLLWNAMESLYRQSLELPQRSHLATENLQQ